MQQYDTATMARMADMNFGIRVERDAATLAAASTPYFNIVTGAIVLISLVGTVTVDIPVAAVVLHWDTATAGTVTALSTDGGSMSGFLVGRQSHLPATVAAQINSTGGAAQDVCPRWVIPVGTLNCHCGVASTTGLVKWTLVYVPFDEGAHVTVA